MKPEYFLPVVAVPWLWGFVRIAIYWGRVNAFVERLYLEHREIWESLGRPCGQNWAPPGRAATPFSMFSFRWEWLRNDPDWLAQTPELHADFQQLREGFREGNFRLFPIMAASAVLFFIIMKLLTP